MVLCYGNRNSFSQIPVTIFSWKWRQQSLALHTLYCVEVSGGERLVAEDG